MTVAQRLDTIASEDQARAELYAFIGLLLERAADTQTLRQVAAVEGDDTQIGRAIQLLSRVAHATTEQTAQREFNTLFIGLGRGEFLPYASYYLTGFLNEKPLAKLRADMARLGIARSEGKHEPEDNIASLMQMMAGLIIGEFAAPATLDEQKEFFTTHIGPWAVHFFTDLEETKNSVFYAAVGTLGRAFMEIESEAFKMLTTGASRAENV